MESWSEREYWNRGCPARTNNANTGTAGVPPALSAANNALAPECVTSTILRDNVICGGRDAHDLRNGPLNFVECCIADLP